MDFKRMFAGIVFVAVAMTAAFTAQAQQAPAAGAPAQGAPAQGGGGRGPGRGPQGPPLTLTSPAFTDLQLLPAKYGCAGGNNISFPLAWANAPAATQSFAVVAPRANIAHLFQGLTSVSFTVIACCSSIPRGAMFVAISPFTWK